MCIQNYQIGFAKTSEFAKFFRLSPRTVSGWIRTGKLRAINFGSEQAPEYRIPHTEVDRFLAQLKRPVL